MKWKLIFLLSLFGLAMAFANTFWIHTRVEPFFWVVIFVVCAWFIAKYAPGRFFLHGLLVGIVNSVWITAVHVILFHQYMALHTHMAQQMASMPYGDHPMRLMVITGPFAGVISGIILGLFALVASRLLRKNTIAG